MKSWIPNTITLLNLLCGCIVVVLVFSHAYHWVFMAMLFAFIFDWSDGVVARLLQTNSEIGKELDSLADMISFGFVPGVMMYMLLANTLGDNLYLSTQFNWFALPGFLITLFSAIRLAKFNLDKRKTEGFFGLATPGSACFVLGLYLIYYYNPMDLRPIIGNMWFLYVSTLIISVMLISEIPMFSFKYKHTRWSGNEIRLLFVITCIVSLIVLKVVAIPLLVMLYILISVSTHYFGRAAQNESK